MVFWFGILVVRSDLEEFVLALEMGNVGPDIVVAESIIGISVFSSIRTNVLLLKNFGGVCMSLPLVGVVEIGSDSLENLPVGLM